MAVAKAAMETGVAQNPVDLAEYREQLEKRLGKAHEMMRSMIHKAQANPKRVVFPEGEPRENSAGMPRAAGGEDCRSDAAGHGRSYTESSSRAWALPSRALSSSNRRTRRDCNEYVQELYRLRQRAWRHPWHPRSELMNRIAHLRLYDGSHGRC